MAIVQRQLFTLDVNRRLTERIHTTSIDD